MCNLQKVGRGVNSILSLPILFCPFFPLSPAGVQMKGMPFNFAYIVDDEATENFQTRQEEGDKQGVVTGCFQVCSESCVGDMYWRTSVLGHVC